MVAKAGSHLLAATAFAVLAGAAVSAGSARAQDATCLAAPHGPAPAGTHWYYKTDQGTHQKCWYTRAATAPLAQTAPSRAVSEQGDAANPDADGAAAPEESAAPVALAPTVAPPVPERAAPPAPAAPRRATSPMPGFPCLPQILAANVSRSPRRQRRCRLRPQRRGKRRRLARPAAHAADRRYRGVPVPPAARSESASRRIRPLGRATGTKRGRFACRGESSLKCNGPNADCHEI